MEKYVFDSDDDDLEIDENKLCDDNAMDDFPGTENQNTCFLSGLAKTKRNCTDAQAATYGSILYVVHRIGQRILFKGKYIIKSSEIRT